MGIKYDKIEDDGSYRYIIPEKLIFSATVHEHDDILFGCEFEFYINDQENQQAIAEAIFEKLKRITKADILYHETGIPSCKDASICMHLKPDHSLKSHGLEISIPVCTYHEFIFYVEQINHLISQYGYTDNDTGLHIHLSTKEANGVNLNFYNFSLLCDKEGLLDLWGQRNGYCCNVMDVINYHTPSESRAIKNPKGRIWNLEKISASRIEIRTMGGVDYHTKSARILEEAEKYIITFKKTLSLPRKESETLQKSHLEKIASATPDQQALFAKIMELYTVSIARDMEIDGKY